MTLATIEPEDVEFTDYVECARHLLPTLQVHVHVYIYMCLERKPTSLIHTRHTNNLSMEKLIATAHSGAHIPDFGATPTLQHIHTVILRVMHVCSVALLLCLTTQDCDLVVAVTHMRWHNDRRLAEEVPEINLILGGHDHDYQTEVVSGQLAYNLNHCMPTFLSPSG